MSDSTHEHSVNDALGEVLSDLRGSWTVRTERTGQVLVEGGRPDVLVEDVSGWPVVVEAELTSHSSAEVDALDRLGKTVARSGKTIETVIALVYPTELHTPAYSALRVAISTTGGFEFALYSRRVNKPPDRLPTKGWLKGDVRDLAMLVHRAAAPTPRVDALADELERGVTQAAENFTLSNPYGGPRGAQIAEILGQSDDEEGQTRRMAMTVVANALVFHASLATANFVISDFDGERLVRPVPQFRSQGSFSPSELADEWDRILERNYWPIFHSARKMLAAMPSSTATAVLDRLWRTAERLVTGGVTRSHDLTGVVFQRLIADRKFLATNYTRPAAATLLAALALPATRPPGGAEWSDGKTLAALQIGDFACGTGTLLSAAYQRLSLLHELNGGNLEELHGRMMKNGLVGLDVLNIAVHLTAAMLAGAHPDIPFEGECLLTMPYAQWGEGKKDVAIGSLDLLAAGVQPGLIEYAAAITAGGRMPEDVRDLVSRVAHDSFDLVIMNPPFSRATSHEGGNIGQGSPAFAAFDTPRDVQNAMLIHLNKTAGKKKIGNMRAGLGTHFVDLGIRKTRNGGTLALVLPTSALSGVLWQPVRNAIRTQFEHVVVVSISEAGSFDRSFSADTGISDCMILATNKGEECKESIFVILDRQPAQAVMSDVIAKEILNTIRRDLSDVKDNQAIYSKVVRCGDEYVGHAIRSPMPTSGPWQIAGIADVDLIGLASRLVEGKLCAVEDTAREIATLQLAKVGAIASVGFSDMEITGDQPSGIPQGPFRKIQPPVSTVPTFPMLWNHDTKAQRQLVVPYDSEGEIKHVPGLEDSLTADVKRLWATASRAHYNRDLQFNANSLVVAMTARKSIGGRAWPSVVFENPMHEFAYALWSNSTLGLLLHWWVSNKSQAGRGTTTVTDMPNIPTIDTRALSEDQHRRAADAFAAMRDYRFLPFDQMDEDPARAELDRRLLVDVLELSPSLCGKGGLVDSLRQKLSVEPQIRGSKKRRVTFEETLDADGRVVVKERWELRQALQR